MSLYFPRSADPAGEEVRTSPTGTLPLRRAGEGETVLLVEDDEPVLGMAVQSLEELRYRVIVARNAAEALEHLRGVERIDILFSDVVMPGGMNGSQLAAEAERVRPGIKILLTSGDVANLDEGQVIGRGELPVLNKPYRREEPARSLCLVLGGESLKCFSGVSTLCSRNRCPRMSSVSPSMSVARPVMGSARTGVRRRAGLQSLTTEAFAKDFIHHGDALLKPSAALPGSPYSERE